MKKRALVICPGRGSYDRSCLGQLQDRDSDVVRACDAAREARGLPTITSLDAEPSFRTGLHVAGEHASLLTFACSLADLEDLSDEYEIVGVAGNSMGWYTALAASGALSLQDAITLVETMGGYQKGNVIGGQVLYPIADDEWMPAPDLLGRVEAALTHPETWWSIRLGGFAVLGGSDAGVAHLMEALPAEKRGMATFPIRLPLHSAFHTPLMQATSERARSELALDFRAPSVPLIDGRGTVFRPRWADPAALRDYTLGHQVVAPYDFTTSVQTALHHCGPDVVVVLGPGNALGGNIARILIWDGWNGLRNRPDFDVAQRAEPVLLSYAVTPQRQRLTA